MNYIRVHAGGITLETGGVQESQVSILWNCGLWAHHVGKKIREGVVIMHDHDSNAGQRKACQLCQCQHRYQGRGKKRTIFLLVERGGPIGKVLVHRWSPECYRQMQQGLNDTVIRQGVYISRRILLLRSYGSQGRLNKSWKGECGHQIKQNNGKENVFDTCTRGIPFPRTSIESIHDRR